MHRLIIIDDEYEIRIGLQNYFPWKDIGFTVVGNFDSAQKGLEYMRQNPLEAVLSDIKMPRMSGLDFARQLQAANSGVRIVFLSGYKDFDFLKESMQYKAFDYLVKPVTHEQIRKTFTALRAELESKPDAEKKSGQPAAGGVGIVAAIKSYIDRNYASTSLEDTAGFIRMNPNYLSRYFKQKTGENFSDYLIGVKMKKARELMGDHGLKTYHISEMVGYNNPNNFTRAFKRLFGISPRDYRNG
jgi:two-component system, response regulator YesN